MVSVVGYTYESAHHCIDCTRKRFESVTSNLDDNDVSEDAIDSDGNMVHALFEGFECDYVPSCDDCFMIIDGAVVLCEEY